MFCYFEPCGSSCHICFPLKEELDIVRFVGFDLAVCLKVSLDVPWGIEYHRLVGIDACEGQEELQLASFGVVDL